MSYRETPYFFDCEGSSLLGVLVQPESPAPIGVVIVVGGPQYRVGSHRQFVLLARALAAAGFACLRFDYRGMGDSGGEPRGFDQVTADVRAAIDLLCATEPRVRKVVLWGLCDGASASAAAAGEDPRVIGLALFNPWVRTDALQAKAAVRHYYARRLVDPAFWRKLVRGGVSLGGSAAGFWRTLGSARGAAGRSGAATRTVPLDERMGQLLDANANPVLIALSGRDAVAAEFRVASQRGSLRDAQRRANVLSVEIPDADHTFSSARWRNEAARITIDWLRANVPALSPVRDC